MFTKFSWEYAFGLIVVSIGLVYFLTNPSEEDYIKYETKRFVAAIDENNLDSIKCSTNKVEFQGKTYLIEFSGYNDSEWEVNSPEKKQIFQDFCVETLLNFKQNQSELISTLKKISRTQNYFIFSYYHVNYDYIKVLIFAKLKDRYPQYITPKVTRYDSQGNPIATSTSVGSGTQLILKCPDFEAQGMLGQIKWCSDGSFTSLIKIRFF